MNIAIIPARAGSKSIINKNLQTIGKRNLVEWAIKSAKASKIFSKIILTTDIPILIEEYKGTQIIVHERDPRLASDNSLMLDVVLSCIGDNNLSKDDVVFLLQPTTPYREISDYDQIIKLMDKGANSVISVCDVGANHPNRMYTINRDILYPLRFTRFDNKQALKSIYIRSGHYYAFRVGDFIKEKSFYIKPCMPLMIDHERAINIDCSRDLEIARLHFDRAK